MGQQRSNPLIVGRHDSIYSEILNEERKLWVYLPYRDNDSIAARKKYPVIYLLDGEWNFKLVRGMLGYRSARGMLPKMILVGILNVNRWRDFTPTATNLYPEDGISGGGEAFISFLENELIPFIDKKYPTGPYRTLIGSSISGLIVVNTLINHPHIFDSYLSSDPSLWYDDQRLMKKADTVLQKGDFRQKALFIGIAQTWDPRLDTIQVQYDTLNNELESPDKFFEGIGSIHGRSILHFVNTANSNDQNGLKFKSIYYPNEIHSSVSSISIFDGLNFLYSWYRQDLLRNLKENIYDRTISADSIVRAVNLDSEIESRNMGYNVFLPQGIIIGIGYDCLGNKFYDKAHALFKMSVEHYPSSPVGFIALARLWKAQGNNDKATKFYLKSLELDPQNQTAKKELAEIKK